LVDRLSHLICDLPEDRAVTGRIQRSQRAGRKVRHLCSFGCLDERLSVATVEKPSQLRGPRNVSSAERPHSVSVAGVIVDDSDRALLIQRRDNGQWEPPGGV